MKKDVFIMFSLFLQIWVKIGAEVAEGGSHHRLGSGSPAGHCAIWGAWCIFNEVT